MKRSSIKAIAAVLALSLLLSGCLRATDAPGKPLPAAASATATPPPETAAPDNNPGVPSYGGTLNLSMRLPKTLNPLLNEDSTVDEILKLIFLPLSVLDATGKPVPNSDFVQSILFSADGLSAEIRLKGGKQWSDQTEITADDIAFSIALLREAPSTVFYKETVKNMLTPEVLDTYAIRLNFIEPLAEMRYLLCFPIIPAHYYQNETMLDPASAANMSPLGNGPYTFAGYQTVESLTLISSDRALSKKPYISQIHVLITSDRDTDFYMFDQGMVDAVYGEIARWGKYLGSNEYRVADTVSTDFDFIGFNHNNPVFQDKAVREAIAHAVPYERILSEVYVNYAVPAKTPVLPDSWLYAPDVAARQTDAAAVTEALARGGWAQSASDGIWRKNPVLPGGETLALSFSILVNEENEERVKIAELLAESLGEAGFTVTVETVDFETYQARLIARTYGVFIGGYHLSVYPDFSFMLKSTNADFGTNILNYKDTVMDALLTAAAASATENAYKKAMTDLQIRIAEELPLISLIFRESAVVMNKKIQGDIRPTLNQLYANIGEWYIR